MLFLLILILCEQKNVKKFCNNLVIHALIVYFCFVLIDLINDHKKSSDCLYNVFYENC